MAAELSGEARCRWFCGVRLPQPVDPREAIARLAASRPG